MYCRTDIAMTPTMLDEEEIRISSGASPACAFAKSKVAAAVGPCNSAHTGKSKADDCCHVGLLPLCGDVG